MDLQISSPCPMRWESLTGDDRVRYCGRCQLNVYNLAVMGKDEVENIFRSSTGRVCGRLYVRSDRTATLRDCPEGRVDVVGRRIRYVFAGLCVLVFALVCRNSSGPDLSGLPDWVQDIARWVDPAAQLRGRATMGVMVCPKLPPAPPVPPPLPPAGGN